VIASPGVKELGRGAEDGSVTDVRCPKCAAHVAVGADWCGQCYTSLVQAPVKAARAPVSSGVALQVVDAPGDLALMGDVPPPPPLPPGSIPPPPAPPQAAPNKIRLGKQPWPCVRCETVNEYENNACKACGRSFLDAMDDPTAALPLVGAIDGSTWVGKLKIGLFAFVPLVVVILICFTIAGLVVK